MDDQEEKLEEQDTEEESLRGRSGALKSVLTYALQLAVMFLVLWFITRHVIGITRTYGSSMEPTLENGDMMVTQIIACHPEQGDVVIAHSPWEGKLIVKRVIATGGQHVSIDYAAGEVRVDDVVLEEPYINGPMTDLGEYYTTEIDVPEDCYFLMGDNRNNSNDSRNPELGPVPEEDIMGKSLCVFFPFTHIQGL